MKRVVIAVNCYYKDNLYLFPEPYVNCIIAAGALPLLVPCHRNLRELDRYIDMADGFVFIGGPDYPSKYYGVKPHPLSVFLHPRRAEADLYLARSVLRRKIPALGICAGHQLINIALGGKLVQHVPRHRATKAQAKRHERKKHAVEIRDGRILSRLFGKKRIEVNSSHHQAIPLSALGVGLQAVAFADGGIIEAVESLDHPFVLGLQWHPERMPWRSHGSKIFGALIKAAQKER